MQCFRNFPVAKSFLDKRGGEHQDFLSKNISVTLPKTFVGQPFCAVFQKFSSSEKVYGEKKWGEYQDFPSNNFSLTVPKNFAGGSFTVSLISGIEIC